jgi:uncharacterized cupin superfamily protein
VAVASVPDSASSTELLAGNSALNGAAIFNDSTEILYLLQGSGTAVVATNWSVKLGPGDYWESPHPSYVRGGLTGIWANNASGAARVTTW